MNETKISKQMAYLLRHDPSGMDVSDEGFVDLDEFLEKLRNRWGDLSREDVRRLVENDSKGRYEIKGDKIRARYGHSIDVNPTLTRAKVDTLYHGTTREAARNILRKGLKSKGRQRVHLSNDVKSARKVGKRRTDNPVILKVDVGSAREDGISFEKASDEVYVADHIPTRYISWIEGDDSD